jgi:hypothetical protein
MQHIEQSNYCLQADPSSVSLWERYLPHPTFVYITWMMCETNDQKIERHCKVVSTPSNCGGAGLPSPSGDTPSWQVLRGFTQSCTNLGAAAPRIRLSSVRTTSVANSLFIYHPWAVELPHMKCSSTKLLQVVTPCGQTVPQKHIDIGRQFFFSHLGFITTVYFAKLFKLLKSFFKRRKQKTVFCLAFRRFRARYSSI